jgi:hypothetical protein
VAVHRRPAGRDEADELRHVRAAEILVDEVAEFPVRLGRQRLPVGKPDRSAGGVEPRLFFLRSTDADDDELLVRLVLHLVLLARCQVGAEIRLERVGAAADVQAAGSGCDVQDLLASFEQPGRRPAAAEPLHTLLEARGRRPGADRDAHRSRVAGPRGAGYLAFGDDVTGHALSDTRSRGMEAPVS